MIFRRHVAFAFAFVVFAALPPAVVAQSGPPRRATSSDAPPAPVPPAVVSRDAEGRVTIRAIRLREPIVLDGRLDERLYHDNAAVADFVQQEPAEGSPATDRTEVWVGYDDKVLYVGARLWETDSSKRVTTEMRRDANLYNNDHFAILLDPFYDRRNGYIFVGNARGGMRDEIVTNENSTVEWNGIWETRAADFDGGWTIEFAIPFRSIRFKEGSEAWGINFRRVVRWKTEASFLSPTPRAYANAGLNKPSSAGLLVGLQTPDRIRNIDVKGYALGSSLTNRNARPAVVNDGNGQFGVDAKWGVTQSYVADFTYNTDFAQVEDDEQQVNLTRFSILFPEKREFFLEGSQFFAFGTLSGGQNDPNIPNVFFSRRIGIENGGTVPIDAGARLIGRSGRYRVGVLSMRTGDEPSLKAVATNFSVVRMQRDVLRRSRIGAIMTHRSPTAATAAGQNVVYGADAVFSLFQNVNFVDFIARSHTPGRTGSNWAGRTRFNYNPDRYTIDLEQIYAGEDFNPEVGFLRRPEGYRRSHAQLEYSPRPKNIRGVRKLYYTADVDYFASVTGEDVDTRAQQLAFRSDFNNGDNFRVNVTRTFEGVKAPFTVAKGVRVPAGGYDFQQWLASYTFGNQRKVSGTATVRNGSFYDGTGSELTWRGRVELASRLYAEPTVSWNRIDTPRGLGYSNLVASRITYTLTPRMFVSGLIQYQSSVDSISTNARFRWEYSPGSELFIVYNDGRTTLGRGVPDIQNRTFAVKVTRLFRF